jgi:hypothetical protein
MEGSPSHTLYLIKKNPSLVCQPQPSSSTTSSPVVTFDNVDTTATTTQANNQTFDAISFMQQLSANMIAAQQSQTIVVQSCANKCRKSEAKFNNKMLQLILVGGIVDFLPPGSISMNLIFQTTCR